MSASGSDVEASNPAERFRVGIEVNGLRGGGVLRIAPGSVMLEMDRPTRAFGHVARIVHTEPDVVVVTARLVPPWFNTSVALHDEQSSARAVLWMGARRRLCDSLRKSGFNVHEATTNFSRNVGVDGQPARQLTEGARSSWFGRRQQVAVAAASLLVGRGLIVFVSQSAVLVVILAAVVILNIVAIFWR